MVNKSIKANGSLSTAQSGTTMLYGPWSVCAGTRFRSVGRGVCKTRDIEEVR